MLNRRKGVIYCAAVDNGYILPEGINRYQRISGRGKNLTFSVINA
jgi:hypothetical protein